MLHPEFSHVCHLKEVRKEASAYLTLWREVARSGKQHADDWAPVVAQEARLNETVEKALGGL